MKKKQYIKPAQRVVLLQHQAHLLQASGQSLGSVNSGYFDYGGSDVTPVTPEPTPTPTPTPSDEGGDE